MILQINGMDFPALPSLLQVDPITLLNLSLVTLTLIFAYFAYRTQHLSTDILDVTVSDGVMEILAQNTSHTSHVVLRIKLRAGLPDESEPRDLQEFSLYPDASNLDYLYPERAGTSKAPHLGYRVELGPLDFTRFRTVHPQDMVRGSTTPGPRLRDDGSIEVHLGTSIESFQDLEEYRSGNEDRLERELDRLQEETDGESNDKQRSQNLPYLIPRNVDKIILEVHQTGEEYVLGKQSEDWHISSKRRRKVKIDGDEYKLSRLEVIHLNLYYWFRYDLVWYLSNT